MSIIDLLEAYGIRIVVRGKRLIGRYRVEVCRELLKFSRYFTRGIIAYIYGGRGLCLLTSLFHC